MRVLISFVLINGPFAIETPTIRPMLHQVAPKMQLESSDRRSEEHITLAAVEIVLRMKLLHGLQFFRLHKSGMHSVKFRAGLLQDELPDDIRVAVPVGLRHLHAGSSCQGAEIVWLGLICCLIGFLKLGYDAVFVDISTDISSSGCD